MKKIKILYKRFLAILAIIILLIFFTSLFLYSITIPSPLLSSFQSVTKTKNNYVGDPINVVFLGDKYKLIAVFTRAHWIIPDPINEKNTIKIIKTSISNSSYPSASVSSLYLYGRVQDVVFELPTNTVRKRHHIRLWQIDKLVSGQHVWLGSASFDSGIELSGTTHFPTHHISPNIDAERDFLMQSLKKTGLLENTGLQRITFPVILGHNGEGDWYFNDGNAEVITLK